jgi:hypothetical protein
VRPLILTADAETSDSDGMISELFGTLENLGMTNIGAAITDASEETPP